MGIGSFIKGGVRELSIARPDSAKGFVVWKHPDPTIPMYAQLTVYPDEVAIFFRDGKVVGVLNAGRHTLDSSNIPFLSNLIDRFTGGNVFKAEVYFVTTREIPDVKFGGRIGEIEDPETGLVAEGKVHGSFSYRVVDPIKFVIGIAGLGKTDNQAFELWFKQQVLKVIRDRVAELIVKQNWGLLKVTSGAYTEEIEAEVLKVLDQHVGSYGIKVIRLGNFVIGIDEEAKQTLREFKRKMAFHRGMGVGIYTQFQMADAIRDMGKGATIQGGSSNNPLLSGAALGVGLGFAQLFTQIPHQQAYPSAYQYQHYDRGGQQPPYPSQQPQSYSLPQSQPSSQPLPSPSSITCSKCGASLPPNSKFCPNCGNRVVELSSQKRFCPNCGTELPQSAKFCIKCGTKLE